MAIPCALSLRERTEMVRWARGKRVVEAGALLGGSTVTLASVAASVISIDRHVGYTGPTLRTFMANLYHAGVASKVDVRVGDAIALLPNAPADIAFIDLTGTFDVTLKALQAVRAPIVMIHDTERQRCGGVAQAIKAMGGRALAQVDTLAVVAFA
jgi:hypothetical protein